MLFRSGDYNIDEISRLVEKYFSAIPSRSNKIPPPAKEAVMRRIREKTVKVEKEQSLVLLGFRGIDVYSKDRYAVDVMIDMLSSASGILFKSLRGDSALSYAQGAFQAAGIDPGYIAVYVLTSRTKIRRVKDIVFKQLSSFREKGPSPGALADSKNHLKGMRQIGFQTDASFVFATSLDELYGLGYNNYKDYDKHIDSVTVGDVRRVAGELLTIDKCAIVILEGVK